MGTSKKSAKIALGIDSAKLAFVVYWLMFTELPWFYMNQFYFYFYMLICIIGPVVYGGYAFKKKYKWPVTQGLVTFKGICLLINFLTIAYTGFSM